jgi:DNA-binding transcriptional ArsR family regulator
MPNYAYSADMGTTKNNDSVELDYLFDQVAGYMQLFAEPTRLRIMHALCDKECSVNEVVEAIGATQTNVSRHLSAMHKSRVLARRKEGTTVYYTVSDPKAVELCRTVCMNIISNMDEQRITHKAANQFMVASK